MSNTIVAFMLSIFLISYGDSANVAYTIESTATNGNTCMTDCGEDRLCWTSHSDHESCTPGWRKAATYYTSRNRYPKITKCLSKCVFDGYDYSWCYIDEDFNWDYCSTATNGITKWYQLTPSDRRCKDECAKGSGTSYLWCYTYWNSWDYCDQTLHYREEAQTIYGKWCYEDCSITDKEYFQCYDETESKQICAPTAVRYECPAKRSRRSDHSAPRRTVAEYNQDIDNDPTLITVTLSTVNSPDANHPILDYTYRIVSSTVRLPVRIRARILPQHVRGRNTRTSSDISSAARTNCNAMGMNVCLPNGNNDQCGHLIPYILGGPSDWYNIVPQTRRINVGTMTNTDVQARSLWRDMERTMHHQVQSGGSVEFQVLVAYDLSSSTRPTGFGTIDRSFAPNGALAYECPGFWYSNDPNDDPDSWNV